MATPPFLPDETKPGASDLISLFPGVEQTFRDIIEDWLLVEHNTTGTHKQVTLDDIATPTIAADLVGLWHESGVLKTRFATGDVFNVLTANTGLLLAGGTMTGDLVLAGAPDADLKAATKAYVDTADALKAPLASPALTGNPTAPTQTAGNDSTRLASTAFVGAAITAAPKLSAETAKAATTGQAINFTGLPAGTNRITVIFYRVSLSGDDELIVQIGDAGGIEGDGYIASASAASTANISTAGFILTLIADSDEAYSGILTLDRVDSNIWIASANMHGRLDNLIVIASGRKSLTAEMTQVRIRPSGSNSFDGSGVINVFTQ